MIPVQDSEVLDRPARDHPETERMRDRILESLDRALGRAASQRSMWDGINVETASPGASRRWTMVHVLPTKKPLPVREGLILQSG